MKRARRAAALVACGLALAQVAGAPGAGLESEAAEAAKTVELRRMFPQEAAVSVEGGGLARLVLPPEILAACRPDLSNLRLFDASDKEVPYLVDAGAGKPDGVEVTRKVVPEVFDAARAEIHREDGPPLRRETLVVGMPRTDSRTGSWVLVVKPRPGEFVARVDIKGVDAPDGESLVKDGSLFRLSGASTVEKLRLSLPPYRGARLSIVFETESPLWLEPAVRLESARRLESGGKIDVPLDIQCVRSDEGHTVIELARPRGVVPDLLRIETSTPTFDRQIAVHDDGLAGLGALGAGAIFRVEALIPVGVQEVALQPARGDRLRVTIEDGDSPALESLAFAAVVRQPSLIFSANAGRPGEMFGTVRFGGGRAHAPRYDLAGLLPSSATTVEGKRAEAAALLYEPAAVIAARLGDIRPNAAYDRTPALAFAMHPGARIDRRLFSHARALTVPASAEGLSRLRIEPADLAILSHNLADLRVADADARQWPYLVERGAGTDLVPIEVERAKSRDGTSRYALKLPVSPMLFDRLILDTDVVYFDRGFSLEAETTDNTTITLARGRLARALGDPRPVTIEVTPSRLVSMELSVEDGDDAQLVLRSAQVRVPLPDLYLTAPAGRYDLLLGAPDQPAPLYELERVREVVLAVQAAPIDAGPIGPNQDYSLNARLSAVGFRQTLLLWVTLGAAVIVLVFMTLRLARREGT